MKQTMRYIVAMAAVLWMAIPQVKAQGLEEDFDPGIMYIMRGEEININFEEANEWEITFEETHRNAAIAHAIFNYATYTGDFEYLRKEGLDVLCGIARFFADRVHFSETQNKYVIHGVTGPNEYENNVNNNWYTKFFF